MESGKAWRDGPSHMRVDVLAHPRHMSDAEVMPVTASTTWPELCGDIVVCGMKKRVGVGGGEARGGESERERENVRRCGREVLNPKLGQPA